MTFKTRQTTVIEFLHICRDTPTPRHATRYFVQKAADDGMGCEAIAAELGASVDDVAALLKEGK